MAGEASRATRRSTSRASPRTASTAGPGLHLPGLVRLEVGVGLADQAPGRLERLRGRHPLPGPGRLLVGAGGRLGQGARRPRRRAHPAALGGDHRGHPRRQVAQVVGQVGVVAGHHALEGELAVGAEALVGEEVVAEPVHPHGVDQGGRGDLVEPGLGHLLPAHQQEAVDVHRLRRLQPGGEQHGRPVDAVEAQDVLADQVPGPGPAVGEGRVAGAVAGGRQVVGEGVEPDVGDVAGVPGQGDPPVDRGPADGEVLEALADEPEGLVAPDLGLHEAGVGVVPVEQGLLVAAQLEEVVLLLHADDRAALALEFGHLLGGHVGLVGHGVEALVVAQLDVAPVVAGLEQLLHGLVVARLGGADEVVVADAQQPPGRPRSAPRSDRPAPGG